MYYPPVYYNLISIEKVRVKQPKNSLSGEYIFTFPIIGNRFRLFLMINYHTHVFQLLWKESDSSDTVRTIVSLEKVLEQVSEEAQSLLLFHLNSVKEQVRPKAY